MLAVHGSPVVPLVLAALLTGCSQSASNGSQSPASSSASTSTSTSTHASTGTAATIPPGTVCDNKLLGFGDLGGIFDEPFSATKPLLGDAQTCYFTTAKGSSLRVTLRPSSGKAVIETFTSGHMDEYAKWQPLAGVGEEAIWKPELSEVSARNGDILCEIAPEAGNLFLTAALKGADGSAKQRKFGSLCNVIFERLHLPGPTSASATPNSGSAGGNVVEPACEKNVLPADVADIISAAVVKQPGYNPQSCSYHAAAGATVTITLSKGEDAKFAWDTMSNPANVGRVSTLAGVGDAAQFSHGGTLVVTRKGDFVCSVDISGTDNAQGAQVITSARGAALAQKLAALCTKVFAAR